MYSNCVLLSVLRLYSMMSSLLSTNSPQLSSCHQEMLMSAQSLLTSWTLLWTLINTSQSLGHHFSIKITQFIKSDTSQELPICKHIIPDNYLYLHCYIWPNAAMLLMCFISKRSVHITQQIQSYIKQVQYHLLHP